LHCKPNKEDFVHHELACNQIDHFYPRLAVKPVNPRSRKIRPYFPGYIFVHLDMETESQITSLRWIPGTVGLVSFDGRAADVPENLIIALQKRVMEKQASQIKEHTFKPGDPIRVLSGPFEGYDGIFDMTLSGTQRAQILIKYLHGLVMKVDLPVKTIGSNV
jgi:transcription antitermination factor NusG